MIFTEWQQYLQILTTALARSMWQRHLPSDSNATLYSNALMIKVIES